MSAPFALYVHFPWCRHVCPYCDFNVHALARPPEASFIASLVRELESWATDAAWAARPIKSVFLGGGTPSLFSAGGIGTLLTAVELTCGLTTDAEITLEANPGTLDRDTLAAYRAAGVNRLSLGAQSFQPALLRTLGRDHTPDDTTTAVRDARAAGFTNLSLDLIFAVPGQSLDAWRDDLQAALALAPDHLSAYALTYEVGTPFHAWRRNGRLQAVGEDDEVAMLEHLTQATAAAGFQRYEISSWARPEKASRHNQSYWDGTDYLGLGPGAHSFNVQPAPGVRFVNERLPDAYRAAVERHGRAVASADQLTAAQARADFIISGLRRVVGVDVTAFVVRFGEAIDACFPHIATLINDGLLHQTAARLQLTERGLLFADTVAATFV